MGAGYCCCKLRLSAFRHQVMRTVRVFMRWVSDWLAKWPVLAGIQGARMPDLLAITASRILTMRLRRDHHLEAGEFTRVGLPVPIWRRLHREVDAINACVTRTFRPSDAERPIEGLDHGRQCDESGGKEYARGLLNHPGKENRNHESHESSRKSKSWKPNRSHFVGEDAVFFKWLTFRAFSWVSWLSFRNLGSWVGWLQLETKLHTPPGKPRKRRGRMKTAAPLMKFRQREGTRKRIREPRL